MKSPCNLPTRWPPPRLVPATGEVLGGIYEILGELGRGAMGVVLLALDRHLGRRVAIKLTQSELSAECFREQFVREARAMAEVNHPNVLAIHAFGQHGGVPYFVMEFVEGTTLEDRIAKDGPNIDLDLAFRILDEICAGVEAIHAARTVHRDLKPCNILLDTHLHVHIADLGLARKCRGENALCECVGTPGYMAPEVLFGGAKNAALSPLSDVYSLGCIAYELFTGHPPFEAATPFELVSRHATESILPASRVRRGLPCRLDRVLLEALNKNPEQRTPSVSHLRSALQRTRERRFDPARILVAEDDTEFRELLHWKLRMAFPDTEVECVGDGQTGLTAFRRAPASAVILDLAMPVLDGGALTRVLRAHPESATVPILILTASGGPHEWRRLALLGADRFLVKPVDLDDLVSAVRSAVRQRTGAPTGGEADVCEVAVEHNGQGPNESERVTWVVDSPQHDQRDSA